MKMALAGWLSKEAAVIAVPVVSLAYGCLVGYLAQRSGFCSIGGIGLGIIGVLLGGCPLRQLTMTSEGNLKVLCDHPPAATESIPQFAREQGWSCTVTKTAGHRRDSTDQRRRERG